MKLKRPGFLKSKLHQHVQASSSGQAHHASTAPSTISKNTGHIYRNPSPASVSDSVNSETFEPTTHELVYDFVSNRISTLTKEEIRMGSNNLILHTLEKRDLHRYEIRLPNETIGGRYLAIVDWSGLGFELQRYQGTINQIYVRPPPSQTSTTASHNLPNPSPAFDPTAHSTHHATAPNIASASAQILPAGPPSAAALR